MGRQDETSVLLVDDKIISIVKEKNEVIEDDRILKMNYSEELKKTRR